jgi:hypothetical protein
MRTREQLIQLRIIHVTVLFAVALFIYQWSQWSDGLWVPISVLAIIGPFRPGLTINKAKQRVLGSIAGLLISILVWFFIHYNYNLLVIIALLLVCAVAFTALQEYTYFIMLVSVMLCVNFDYMNLFFNNEIVYIANRGMCVLTGVCLCQFFEYFVFKHSYSNAQALVEKEQINDLVIDTWNRINQFTPGDKEASIELTKCLDALLLRLEQLRELKESCQYSYSEQQQTLQLIEHYELKLISSINWISSLGGKLLFNKQIDSLVLGKDRFLASDQLCN